MIKKFCDILVKTKITVKPRFFATDLIRPTREPADGSLFCHDNDKDLSFV